LSPRYHEPDWWLLAVLLTLTMLGVVMVYSSTSGMTAGSGANGYVIRQVAFAGMGLLVLLVAMRIDYHRYRALALPGIVGVVGLMVLLMVAGIEVNGAKSWFDLGPIQLQPSELAKPALVIYLASWLCAKGAKIRSVSYGLVQFALVMGGVVGLVMLEPDLGAAIILGTIGVAMFFVAGAHLVQFAGLLMAGAVSFLTLALTAPYRRDRLLAFLDPESDTAQTGWHLLQARLAMGSGGFFGVGLGASRQKFTWLPAPHNDAIFAIIGEELGLIGCAFVLGLFVVLGYRGYTIARRAPDQFGTLVAVGVTTWLIFQAVFNIGGVTAAIPFTGITLPFVSYGGSSLMVSMGAVGILLNISRQTAIHRIEAPARPASTFESPPANEEFGGATAPFDTAERQRVARRASVSPQAGSWDWRDGT
jgi:cell division protein FtsW